MLEFCPEVNSSLSRFQDGVIPVAVESLEPSTLGRQQPIVTGLLDTLHLHLLQAAAALQNSYMRSSQSWSENDRLGRSINMANGVIGKLLTCELT